MDVNLAKYIEYCRSKKIDDEAIRKSLITAGWKEPIVGAALNFKPVEKKTSLSLKMWTGPVILAAVLLTFTNIYNFLYSSGFTQSSSIEAIAAAAALMIGISFSLSSMSYYFDFLDNKLAYRKEIGLIGYYLAVTYTILLAVTIPDKYLLGFFKNLFSWDFVLGLSAMAILTAMAIVSINKVMIKITPAVTRRVLRLGFLAYLLLIIRAIVIQHDTWISWFATYDGLPPARLPISFFAGFVIMLRLMMAISIFFKNKRKVVPV